MATDGIAIRVDHVGKTFRLPHDKRNSIKGGLISLLKHGRNTYESQEVLKDVSFEVRKGEFFGIVGRNGSGKSTLLKLLAGIYSPTEGGIEVIGSLTPFIELGVGFNPELTGRENVYLNGSLLGFKRNEVAAMYDDIVEFAELRRFMDQKLKNYSSGMQVRLAFSIAIRANSDILVLDEVLAVGDEAFQRKCYDYFYKLKEENKTVVLVTHDMDSVRKFCSRAMLIEDGNVKAIGSPDDVASQYSLDNLAPVEPTTTDPSSRLSLSRPVLDLAIIPKSAGTLKRSDDLVFDVIYEHEKGKGTDLYVGIGLLYGNISILEHNTIDIKPHRISETRKSYTYRLPLSRFTQGEFRVTATVLDAKTSGFVAFTTQEGSYTFLIEPEGKKEGGLLVDRGQWE